MNSFIFSAVNPATGEQIETFPFFAPNGVTVPDPRVPVGGVKNSGYGRELSHFGPHTFVNAQTVWIENSRANCHTINPSLAAVSKMTHSLGGNA